MIKHIQKWINRTAAGMLILCMAAALSGCVGPQYTPEAEAGVEEAGIKKMQEWLDQKRPGAKVTKANAYIDILLGGPHVLTDYVEGSYTDGEESFRFMYNTQDDTVFTSKGIEELQDPAWDYLLESLGLEAKDAPRRTKDEAWVEFLAELRIPSAAEDSATKPNHEFYQEGLLPWEIAYGEDGSDDGEETTAKRVEAFLRDPDRGYQIAMAADLLLPDGMELTRFIPGELIGIMHDRGLYFDWLRIHNSQEKSMFNGWFGQYSRYDWVDEGDFRLWTELDYVEDTVSAEEEKGYVRKETHVDPADFHPVIPTEKGY